MKKIEDNYDDPKLFMFAIKIGRKRHKLSTGGRNRRNGTARPSTDNNSIDIQLTTSPSKNNKSISIHLPILHDSGDEQTSVDYEEQRQVREEDVVVPEVGQGQLVRLEVPQPLGEGHGLRVLLRGD